MNINKFRILGLLAGSAIFSIAILFGCGGGGASAGGGNVSPFAGQWVGAYNDQTNGRGGSFNVTVDNSGNLSGTVQTNNDGCGEPGDGTISGHFDAHNPTTGSSLQMSVTSSTGCNTYSATVTGGALPAQNGNGTYQMTITVDYTQNGTTAAHTWLVGMTRYAH